MALRLSAAVSSVMVSNVPPAEPMPAVTVMSVAMMPSPDCPVIAVTSTDSDRSTATESTGPESDTD